jgi:hypothetical protein
LRHKIQTTTPELSGTRVTIQADTTSTGYSPC